MFQPGLVVAEQFVAPTAAHPGWLSQIDTACRSAEFPTSASSVLAFLNHSCRKASTAWRRAARTAGKTLEPIAMATAPTIIQPIVTG